MIALILQRFSHGVWVTIEVPVIEHLRCEKPGARLLCKPNRTVEPLGMR